MVVVWPIWVYDELICFEFRFGGGELFWFVVMAMGWERGGGLLRTMDLVCSRLLQTRERERERERDNMSKRNREKWINK